MRHRHALSALLLLSGCGSEPEHKMGITPATPMRVATVAVAETDWPSAYEATGTVHARTTATISSKIMAYAREVRAQVGDHVREGQVLVFLDASDLETAVARAEAGRDGLRSAIPETESAVALAGSQLDLAEVTFSRIQELLNKKSVTNQEYDEALARLKAGRAGLDMERARRTQLDAKIAQIEQEVRTARIQSAYSQIIAPFSGTIITRSIEPGTLAIPGASLFTVEHDGNYRLEASVEESRLSLAHVGTIVSVTIDGMKRAIPGRVGEAVPSVDAAARTGTVKVDLPPLPELRSGLFGRAFFDDGVRNVLAVPAAGVVNRGQLQSVYVAENNIVRLRMVTTGKRLNDTVEVLSGLNQGDRVIIPIPAGIADGAPIEVSQ